MNGTTCCLLAYNVPDLQVQRQPTLVVELWPCRDLQWCVSKHYFATPRPPSSRAFGSGRSPRRCPTIQHAEEKACRPMQGSRIYCTACATGSSWGRKRGSRSTAAWAGQQGNTVMPEHGRCDTNHIAGITGTQLLCACGSSATARHEHLLLELDLTLL